MSGGRPVGSAPGMLAAVEAETGMALSATIEIADRCNEVCVHCYQEQGRKGEMDTDELKSVIDQLAEMGVLLLTISGGEATLRKDFLEIMRHARARGFALRLFTNGLTMTRELAAELHALALDVVEISVYSHRAEVHDFVTGVPGSFERTRAGIGHLVALGVAVHVKTPVMRVNEDEVDDYVAWAESLGVSYSLDPMALSPREHETLEPAALSRSPEAFRRLLAHPRVGVEAVPPPAAPAKRSLCAAGKMIHIEPNGEVRPCVVLPMGMGSALEGSGVAGSRQSEVKRGLAELSWADVHGCRDCGLQDYCARCHAQSLAEVGDALAPYPSACETAQQQYEHVHGVRLRREALERGVGPYRVEGGERLLEIEDRVCAADDALAERLGWVRGPAMAEVARSTAAPGQLVKLRRPGGKRARAERVPGALGEAGDAAE